MTNSQSSTAKDPPFVSVIVPVYNDAGRIGKCIEALLGQSYPARCYEVLIIDNGSTDGTCNTIRRYHVGLLIEDKIKSSYGARNRGIRSARGEIIALTDSDCIPAKDWIEKGVARLLGEDNCGLIGGKIDIFFRDKGCPNSVELYDSITGFNQKEDIERLHFGSTANVFTFREVFDRVGLFNDSLKSGGDNEWGRRVHSHGYRLVYAEDAVVQHPARHSYRQLYNRITRLTGGCYEQYWKGSCKAYLKELAGGIRTVLSVSVRVLLGLYPSDTLKGLTRKWQYLWVVSFIEIISAWERTRLLLGGEARR